MEMGAGKTGQRRAMDGNAAKGKNPLKETVQLVNLGVGEAAIRDVSAYQRML